MTASDDLRIQSGYLQINDKSFPIYEGVNIIGRHVKATVSLKDVILSKLHAIISVVDVNTHLISDLHSANATKLGNVKLNPYEFYNIADKDIVTFGNLIAVYFKNAKCPVNQKPTETPGCDYEALTQIINEPATQLDNSHEAETEITDCDFKKPTTTKVLKINSIDIHDQPTQVNSSNCHEMVTQEVENHFDESNINNDITQVVPLKSVLNNNLSAAGDNEQVNDSAIFEAATQIVSTGFGVVDEDSFNLENEVTVDNDNCEMETQPSDLNFSKVNKGNNAEKAIEEFDHLSPIHCYDDIFSNESFRMSLEQSISKYDAVVDETVIDNQSFKANNIPDNAQVPPANQPIGFKRKSVKPSDDSQDVDKQTQPIGFKRQNIVPLPASDDSVNDIVRSDDSEDIVMGTQDVNKIETDIARSKLNCAKVVVVVDSDSATDMEDSADISKKIHEMNNEKEKTDSDSDTDVDEDLTSESSTKTKKKKLVKKNEKESKSDYESEVEESEESTAKEEETTGINNTAESDSATDVEDSLLADADTIKDDNYSDAETQPAELKFVPTPVHDSSDAETDVEELNTSAPEKEKAEDSATDVEDNLLEAPDCVVKKVNVEDDKRSETSQINNILENDSDTDVEEDLLQVSVSSEADKEENENVSENTSKDAVSIELENDDSGSKDLDNKKESCSIQVLKDSSRKGDDSFLQPTQILEPVKSVKSSVEDRETNDLPPTQLLTESHKEIEDDIFLQRTQKLEPIKSTKSNAEDTETNELPPTQLLTDSHKEIEEDDIFLQPTQKLQPIKSTKSNAEDAETNELPPTQLLTDSHKEIEENDLFLQPAQKLEPIKSIKSYAEDAETNELPPTQLLTDSHEEIEKDDPFLQLTQIQEPIEQRVEDAETNKLPPVQLSTEPFNGSEKKSNKDDEDDLFLQPTQVLHISMDVEEKQTVPEDNDVYNLATQKLPDMNNKKQDNEAYSISTQKLDLESPNQIFVDPLNDSQDSSLRLYMSEDSVNGGRDSLETKKVDTSAVDVETQLEVNFDLDRQKFYAEEQIRRPNNPVAQMFSDEETQVTQNEDIKNDILKMEQFFDIESGLMLVPVVAKMDLTKSKITLKDIQDASTSKIKKSAVRVQKPRTEPIRKSRRNQSSTPKLEIITSEPVDDKNDVSDDETVEFAKTIEKPTRKSRRNESYTSSSAEVIITESIDDVTDDDETETIESTKTIEKRKTAVHKKCESSSDDVGKQKYRVNLSCADKTNKTKDKEDCDEFVKPRKAHNTRGKWLNYKTMVGIDKEEEPTKEESNISKKVEPCARVNKRISSLPAQSKIKNDADKTDKEENELTKPRARISKRKSSVSVQKTESNDSDDDFKISRHIPRKRTLDNRKEDKERTKNGLLGASEYSSKTSISSTDRRKRTKVLKIYSSEESEMTASSYIEGSVEKTPRSSKTPRSMRTPKRNLSSSNSESSESLATTIATTSVSTLESPTKKQRHYEPLKLTVTSESTNVSFSFKHKVVFTMLSDDSFKTSIKKLGGSVINTINSCTVLVTNKISRSLKFLLAIALGKPIVDVNWIDDSIKEGRFLDPWRYILNDPEMEKKLDMNLKQSLKRSCEKKLLAGETVFLAVNKNFDVLKDIIETSGAKCVSRISLKVPKMIVVAYPEERPKYLRFLKQKALTVVSAEAIFSGVLTQELHLNKYLLS